MRGKQFSRKKHINYNQLELDTKLPIRPQPLRKLHKLHIPDFKKICMSTSVDCLIFLMAVKYKSLLTNTRDIFFTLKLNNFV